MTTMSEYAADPARFVTPEQHTLLDAVNTNGALRVPAGPVVNPLLHRGLVVRQQSQAVALTRAGRTVLRYLNERG